jgi:hypothetical protein
MAYTRVQAGDDVTPEQINDVYDSMEKLEAITAEVTETLPAGSPATAQVVTDGSGNKKLELKIPQGATGATGQDGTNGKSVEWQGEWDTNVNYVNTAVKADLVRKDGNVYICKQNNQGAPPPNAVYWALFVQKGEDGLGAGNIKGTNVTALEVGKTYAIQATTIPSEDGTLEGILVEVASVEDLDRKLEKNFDGFYSEKTVLNDNDLFVIQDSESGATPKVNKKVKASKLWENFRATIRDFLYPVGAIYMSTSSTNPSAFIGGSWTAWGGGRVPVGIGSNGETNYTEVEATGGSQTSVATHNHGQFAHAHTTVAHRHGIWSNDKWSSNVVGRNYTSKASGIGFVEASDGGYNHYTTNQAGSYLLSTASPNTDEVAAMNKNAGSTNGNMQPYITCYMWKRIA